MSDDLLITPGSRKLEIKDSSGNIDAKIETDASGNLLITNAGGDISIGDTSSDVFIGDGTNNVDIVFEQNGEIRGTSGVTLTLGASGSNVAMGTDLSLGGNDLTNVGDLTVTGNLTITGDINSYNVTDLDVSDKTITLGVGQTEANSGDSGIIISGSNASMLWSESNDKWSFNKGISTSGVLDVNGTAASSFYAANFTRSSSGLVTPDIWGSNSTLVLGTSSGDERLALSTDGALIYGRALIRQASSDQNTNQDSASIPATTGAEIMRFEGNYTNGTYTTEFAKVDRSGNLPLYVRQSKGTANSFSNIARFGDHGQSNGGDMFAVFGGARVTGRVTAANLTLNSISTQSSETTVLTINGSSVVGKRDLGSNAFNSTAYLPLAGGTMSGNIAMSNYNITGVNQLEFNDPGEGIVFKQGSSGDMVLKIIDDSSDNILQYSGTSAVFDVVGTITTDALTNSGNTTLSGNIRQTLQNVGIPTTYGQYTMEATDAQIDLVSSNAGTWGSAINLVEGSSSSANNNVWSIARNTGSSPHLNFNFGTSNQHDNGMMMKLSSGGQLTTAGNIVNDIGNTGNDSFIELRNTGYTGNVTSLRQNADSTRAELNSTERSIFVQAGSSDASNSAEFRVYTNTTLAQTIDDEQNTTFAGQVKATTTADATPAIIAENTGGVDGIIQEWIGDSDKMQMVNISAGDYTLKNNQQGNGISFFDGTGGVGINYNDAEVVKVGSEGGLVLYTGTLQIPSSLVHRGDTDTYVKFDDNRVRIVDGGTTYLDTNNGSAVLHTGTQFGGDVSGTYDAIVVADDSHNHVISNVDGLQTALDGKLPLTGGTLTGKLTLPDAGFSVSDAYHSWKRSYVVSASSPQEIKYHDGTSLDTGGVYRFTAHISGTGTDQSATAVFWNQNGTWRVNVTGQSGTSSNHPEFIISSSTNKPTIHIDHTSTYTVIIYHEWLQLNEQLTGTDNAGYAFGTDAFLGSVGDKLYFTPNGTTATGVNSYDDGDEVYHEGHKPTYSELGTMAYSNLTGTPTIPTNNNQLTNGAGYITGLAFNNLTGKTSGTGEYSTSSYLTAGRGSGGVSLTHNDGYGNANVTFNHKSGVPEQAGNCGRIVVNTDSTTGAKMTFELLSNNGTTAINTPSAMELTETGAYFTQYLYHLADTDTYIRYTDNRIRIVAGGTTKFDSDNTYLTSAGGTITGNLSISKDNPVLILNDTTSSSNADQIAYISFQDDGTEEAWVGWGSNGNTNFTINNSIGSIVLNGSTSINGTLTMGANNISMSNSDITGVNALTINDPGEGIIFTGTNNVSLYAVDDANDNIMKFDGAAKLLVSNDRVLVSSERDLATNSTGTSSTDFVTVYTVNGNNLASHVRLSVTGTTGNVVVSCVADIICNHSGDIFISSMSGNYTQLDIKVTSNGNEDFAIECKRTDSQTSQATLRYSLVVLSQDTTISQPSSHSYSTTTLTHRTKPGSYQSATSDAAHGYFPSLRVENKVMHDGDTDTNITFDNNRVRIFAGNTVKFDSNNTYLTGITSSQVTTALGYTPYQESTALTASSITASSSITMNGVGDFVMDRTDNAFSFVVSSAQETAGRDVMFQQAGGGEVTGSDLILNFTNISVPNKIYHTGDSNTYMQFSANDTWRVVANGGERLKVTSGGTTLSDNLAMGGNAIENAGQITATKLHVGGDSTSYSDGNDPDISTDDIFATVKVVSPKIVWLNDANGDDNYVTCNDNNNTYTVKGNQSGAWWEWYGDKTLGHGGHRFDYWKGKGAELTGFIQFTGTGTGTEDGGYIYFGNATTYRINPNQQSVFAPGTTTNNTTRKGIKFNHGMGPEPTIWYHATGTGAGMLKIYTTQSGVGDIFALDATDGDGHFKGDVTAFSTTTTSDIKLKENVRDLEGALDTTLKLRGVKFDWKDENKANDQLGFIAQEVEEVLPEIVKEVTSLGDNDETHKSVNYSAVVPILVEAIKELKEEIDDLKQQLKNKEL